MPRFASIPCVRHRLGPHAMLPGLRSTSNSNAEASWGNRRPYKTTPAWPLGLRITMSRRFRREIQVNIDGFLRFFNCFGSISQLDVPQC